jgi:hypothetical protein
MEDMKGSKNGRGLFAWFLVVDAKAGFSEEK